MIRQRTNIAVATVLALTLTLGSAAFAGDISGLAKASAAFAQKANDASSQIGKGMVPGLVLMTSVPADLSPLPADQALQTRLDKLKAKLQHDAGFILNTTAIPESALDSLQPLAQKVAGMDCFATEVNTPVGDVLVKGNRNSLTVIGMPSKAALDTLAAGETGEYSIGEAAALDKLDSDRYALSKVRPGFGLEFYIAVGADSVDVESLSAQAKSLHQQALAFIGALVSQKALTHFHWRVKELPFGVFGQSVLSFRPTKSPNVLQAVLCGYSIYYVTDGTLFAVTISRYPDVFAEGANPPMAPRWTSERPGTWFSSDDSAN